MRRWPDDSAAVGGVAAVVATAALFLAQGAWANRAEDALRQGVLGDSDGTDQVAAALGLGCGDAGDHGISTLNSVEAMQDCLRNIVQYAERTQKQRNRSLMANQQYADRIETANAMLRRLVEEQRAHRHLFQSLHDDQQKDVDALLKELASDIRPHDGAVPAAAQATEAKAAGISAPDIAEPREERQLEPPLVAGAAPSRVVRRSSDGGGALLTEKVPALGPGDDPQGGESDQGGYVVYEVASSPVVAG